MTPAKNLSPVSLTPAINPCHGFSVIAGVVDTGDKFITGVVDTADKYSFAIISANFRKNLKQPQWDTQRPGTLIYEKNLLSDL